MEATATATTQSRTDEWRTEKVAFVSGHHGGPLWEVVVMFAVVPVLGCLLARLSRAVLLGNHPR